jgi:serine/threonine protein kinase/tetratricopeptide (TPR) repeat protein
VIGTKLGPYEITEEIGKGGMATVYRAYQPSMDRHVAVKVIRASMLGDSVGRDRFTREAKLVAKLEHPHLLPVYDFDGAHDPPYIVMRFLEGGTLKQVMDADPLPPEEMLYMLRQVATALDYAHRQEVVHRDLKPSNVMIDREGNAFVADFGIARVTDAAKDLTGTGNVIGTPGYMAPEQARGKDGVDGRADVYSLGVIAFELLAGQGPYDRESAVEELMAHLQEPVPDITEVNANLSPEVNEVVQKALAKDREDRYATSGEFIDELAKALHKQAAGSPSQLRNLTQSFAAEQIAAIDAGSEEVHTATDVQRQMTALYMDVSDFAELLYESEETDAVQRDIDRLWHAFEGIAEDHGGLLESRTGEAGLMIWGRAETNESDPEQAIRAALQMKETIVTQAEKRWGETEEEPPFKAAITTGPVLLTREKSGDTTASGATITLAGRLKEAAPPGEVMISHDTYTQVRGVFTAGQLPPVRMRGRAEPLEVYQVVQAKPRAFRQQVRGIEGVETKMIGREPELKILQDALTLTMEDRETQVVTVVGDAGVGKSRLLYEFFSWVELMDETVWFFEARATQPSMLQPYSLTRDLFSFRFGILDNDPLPVVHEKFEEGIAGFLNGNSEKAAPMIGQLVGFDFSDSTIVQPKMEDPESFHREALGYLGEFFLTASKTNPVLIQVEDIHWADERSLDLLNGLARENTEIPLFIIYMARPGLYDRRPSWGEGQEFHARLALNPLSRLDSRRLVREMLKKVDKVPSKLRDLIIDRAEGNPYYMEELIKTLIDDGVIIKGDQEWHVELDRLNQARVPGTLVGVLQSRLDSFPTGQRALMQRASVVGRIFWESAVAHLSEKEGTTAGAAASMLNDLRRREMVFKREESAFEGTAEYGFRHAILRDVVYDTIVPRQRRVYHKHVADWLKEAGKDRLDEYNLLIAGHYEQAEENSEAARFLSKSASASFALGSGQDAIKVLQKAIELVEGADYAAQRAELQVQLGTVYALLGQYPNARAQLEPALEQAREIGDRKVQAAALAELARTVGMWQGQHEAGMEYLAEAMPIAEELGDKSMLAFLLRQMGNLAALQGNAEDALKYLERSVELAREIDDDLAEAAGLNSIGIVLQVQGQYEDSLKYFDQGIVVAEQIGDNGMQSMLLLNASVAHRARGEVEDAHSTGDRSLSLAFESGSDYLIAGAHQAVGGVLIEQGEHERAKDHLDKATQLSRAMGTESGLLYLLPLYARWLAAEGDLEAGWELLEFADTHPAGDPNVAWAVEFEKNVLREEMLEEQIQTAQERAAKRDLDEIITELLGETESAAA